MRLGLVLRELEQVQRAFDVHLMRGGRRELGTRREQRGQVVDGLDLELRQDALEQRLVHDRAGELALHHPAERGIERVHVQRDDRVRARAGEVRDQAVADLATGAGDEDNGFSNHQ